MGTKPAGPGAAWLNPSFPQRSQIPALGSPSLLRVCVEGGFASPPPLLRYFGAVSPALVSATVEGEEAMSDRTGGALWVLPWVLLWVLPSQGRQEGCGCRSWPRLWPAGQAVAVRAVLGIGHPPNRVQSGGGTEGAQHPGGWERGKGYVHGAKEWRQAGERGQDPPAPPGLCRAAAPRDETLWAIPGQGDDGEGWGARWTGGRREGRQ